MLGYSHAMRSLRFGFLISLVLLIGAPVAGAANPLTAFTLVVPKATSASGLQARAVLPNGVGCPTLSVTVEAAGVRSEKSIRMTARRPAPSTGAAFSALFACQAPMPANAVRASVGATTIPASLPATIRDIALFGDTGCRLKKGDPTQDCSSPARWPIARVAASIARERPDLIVHTGDYFYREMACPADKLALCGGSPAPVPGKSFKDTDHSWLADTFVPFAPLFATAPILAVRGNHEACNRGGNGWYLFLDPWDGTERRCAPGADGEVPEVVSRTWSRSFPIGNGRSLNLAIVDSAYGFDYEISPWAQRLAPYYRAAAVQSARAPGRESWLITHRPVFGISEGIPPGGGDPYLTWIAADQTAAALPYLRPFSMILSSHIHVAQASQIPGQPGQLVVGNGGVLRESFASAPIPPVGPLRNLDGSSMLPGKRLPANATSSWTARRFGYVMARPGAGAGQWTFVQRDPRGKTFATCRLANRTISCKNR